MTVFESFYKNYKENENGCWIWLRALSAKGYGQLRVHGRTRIASRLSWEISRGKIPDGMFVCHKCDTPACINPDHLFLGTSSDNAQDRENKDRGNRDKRLNGMTKINFEIAEKIRRAYVRGKTRHVDLAPMFGLKKSQISNILRGKCW